MSFLQFVSLRTILCKWILVGSVEVTTAHSEILEKCRVAGDVIVDDEAQMAILSHQDSIPILISRALFCKYVLPSIPLQWICCNLQARSLLTTNPRQQAHKASFSSSWTRSSARFPMSHQDSHHHRCPTIIHQPNRKQNPLRPTLLDRDHENRTFQPLSCDGWRFLTQQLFLVVAGAALLLWSCIRKSRIATIRFSV